MTFRLTFVHMVVYIKSLQKRSYSWKIKLTWHAHVMIIDTIGGVTGRRRRWGRLWMLLLVLRLLHVHRVHHPDLRRRHDLVLGLSHGQCTIAGPSLRPAGMPNGVIRCVMARDLGRSYRRRRAVLATPLAQGTTGDGH